VPELAEPHHQERVAILLSVFNGEHFLREQLESLLVQTHRSWQLYWRDDGSDDRSASLLRAFGAGPGKGRVCEITEPFGRLGAMRGYFTLLVAAPPHSTIAFSDQDDVWLPEKPERGLSALAAVPDHVPALYCARQTLVDANLTRLGLSASFVRPPGFPAALTQNIVTGCTAMLNRPAASILVRSLPPSATLHDWWSYLVVAAAGGYILLDPEPAILYRQHAGNLVGARPSRLRRALRALRRGPKPFMALLRQHVASLAATPELLSPAAQESLDQIAAALAAPPWRRLSALSLAGFFRQTPLETALFRVWFLLG